MSLLRLGLWLIPFPLASDWYLIRFLFFMKEAWIINSAILTFPSVVLFWLEALNLDQRDSQIEILLEDFSNSLCFSASLNQICTLCLKERTVWWISLYQFSSADFFWQEYIKSFILLNFLVTLKVSFVLLLSNKDNLYCLSFWYLLLSFPYYHMLLFIFP